MITKIIDLNSVDDVAAGDQIPLYSAANGDTRRTNVTSLVTYVEDNITVTGDDKVTQYSAPSATGFTVTITQSSSSVWLILTPVAGYATGTIALPATGVAVDRQEVLVNCTQIVTTLTVSASGLTVTGAPTTLAANARFRMRYDAVTKVWYQV